MQQCDFPMRITLLHMRPLHYEHHGTKACNDADPCATLRAGVRGIYLTAPLDAQAWSEVQTGLLPRLQPHSVAPLHGDAVEGLTRAERRQWETGHSLHDGLQSLCQMG